MNATLIGAAGVALLLVAFLLNLMKRMKAEGTPYLLLNFLGAGLACWSAVLIGFVPFMVLEGIWALVALAGVVRNVTR